MLHAFARGELLHIAIAITATRALGVKVVSKTLFNQGDGFETRVGVGREAGYGLVVVHAKRCIGCKVLTPFDCGIGRLMALLQSVVKV